MGIGFIGWMLIVFGFIFIKDYFDKKKEKTNKILLMEKKLEELEKMLNSDYEEIKRLLEIKIEYKQKEINDLKSKK